MQLRQGMHDDAKDGEKEVWLSGSPELKRWFIWESCHPLGKLSRVQILHQEMRRL